MVADVVATVQPLVEKQSNTLAVSCPAETGEIYADLTKVRQILFNLLANASKFTENGAVQLQVVRERKDEEDWIAFQVVDSGIGMTLEQIGGAVSCLRPGRRLDRAQVRWDRAGAHHQQTFLRVHGRRSDGHERTGSRVGVYRPLAGAAMAPPEGAERPASSGSSTEAPVVSREAPVVLVIDDEPPVRETLVRFLTAEGLQPVTADADGEEGLGSRGPSSRASSFSM